MENDYYIDDIQIDRLVFESDGYSGDDASFTLYSQGDVFRICIKAPICVGLAPLEAVSGETAYLFDNVWCSDPVLIASICQLADGEPLENLPPGSEVPLVKDPDAWFEAHKTVPGHGSLPHRPARDYIASQHMEPL